MISSVTSKKAQMLFALKSILFLIVFCFSTSCQNYEKKNVEAQLLSKDGSHTRANDENYLKSENSSKLKIDNLLRINPSSIINDLEKKKNDTPNITTDEIVVYGNKLIKEKGFNFHIDLADLVEKKAEAKETDVISDKDESFPLISFPHSLTLVDGTKKTFWLIAPQEAHCCCGYHYSDFPVTKITDEQMTVVVNNQTYDIKRTKEISISQEHILIDSKTMKKAIRKWQVPYETYPYGISEDGTKLYIDLEDDILLEISENGDIQFVSKNSPKIITKGIDLNKHPTPKVGEILQKSGELGYMKFTSGSKSFIVEFPYICT
jgi:hypothetical protein